jgi:hypothetical protein
LESPAWKETNMPKSWKYLAILLVLVVPQRGSAQADSVGPDGYRLSEPVSHGNLAIYFIHGASRGGPVPLTLEEALQHKTIVVRETGQVNELSIENTGDRDIFIQAGDIVKGGQQDRVLSVSRILPSHSGAIPISSFCVEAGRWSARGGEDSRTFGDSSTALPSRAARLRIAESLAANKGAVASGQQEIWRNVAEIQTKLSSNLGVPVAAPRSSTSLQLSLENERLASEQRAYIAALEPKGTASDDIVGFVFAINGRINSADIYPSNGLFRKMWPKLLRRSVTEAIGERGRAAEPPPATAAATEFITKAQAAPALEANTGEKARAAVRQSATTMAIEARPAAAPADAWIHRSVLAK